MDEQPPIPAGPAAGSDQDWDDFRGSCSQDVLDAAWELLRKHEESTGQPYWTTCRCHFEHPDDVVSINTARPPQSERAGAQPVGVRHDVRSVTDATSLHRPGEGIGGGEHECDGMRSIDQIGGPIQEDGTGDVAPFVLSPSRAVLPPPQIDHDHIRVGEM